LRSLQVLDGIKARLLLPESKLKQRLPAKDGKGRHPNKGITQVGEK
jgi:hypothetical protein